MCLFADTIENNIKFDARCVSHEEEEVVNSRCCRTYHKLRMDIYKGSGGKEEPHPGGEKQRIDSQSGIEGCANRLLDEATANVDPENEKGADGCSRCTQGKNIIMIAHRLKTVRHADQIVVVERKNCTAGNT